MDEGAPGIFERPLRKMREAFFLEGLDIARQDIQREVGRRSNADNDLVLRLVVDGRAHASLDTDYKEAERMGVRGNPREARGTPARPISLSSRRVPI
jgi:predicted DsbA family dithiol-disulfide isomerase